MGLFVLLPVTGSPPLYNFKTAHDTAAKLHRIMYSSRIVEIYSTFLKNPYKSRKSLQKNLSVYKRMLKKQKKSVSYEIPREFISVKN